MRLCLPHRPLRLRLCPALVYVGITFSRFPTDTTDGYQNYVFGVLICIPTVKSAYILPYGNRVYGPPRVRTQIVSMVNLY